MVKLLAFDLDGTLFDSQLYFNVAFEYIAKWLEADFNIEKKKSIKIMKEVLQKRGSSYKMLFNESLSILNIESKDSVRKAVKLFHEAPLEGVELYPDSKILKVLSEKYDIAIVTLGSKKKQERKIEWFNINELTKYIIYSQDIGYHKPDPKLYFYLEKKTGISANEILVIGDNPIMDFPGAKVAGMKTCRLVRGEFKNLQLKEMNLIDFEINSLEELLEILK
jgi:putative hydrolase of the HAD superfamily